jgi:NADH:ubiquinone oxidoreductase subunit 5 (subunit L)/multisubunit Na+/H+ antiporter MnhA subunit
MTLDNSSLLLLAAPAAMLFVSLAAIWRPAPASVLLERLSVGAAAFSIYLAAIGVSLLINHGPMHSAWLGWPAFGLSIQIEPLSMAAFSIVSLAAFYFIRRALGYVKSKPRFGAFLGQLTATVASFQLLILTGHLAMLVVGSTLAGLALHQLLGLRRAQRDPRHTSNTPRLSSPRGI